MNNRQIVKRVRQYRLCKTLEYMGYIIIGLSFMFLLSIAGTDDYYEALGTRGPAVHIMLIQFVVSVVCGFIGYKLSTYSKKWAEHNKRKMIKEQ